MSDPKRIPFRFQYPQLFQSLSLAENTTRAVILKWHIDVSDAVRTFATRLCQKGFSNISVKTRTWFVQARILVPSQRHDPVFHILAGVSGHGRLMAVGVDFFRSVHAIEFRQNMGLRCLGMLVDEIHVDLERGDAGVRRHGVHSKCRQVLSSSVATDTITGLIELKIRNETTLTAHWVLFHAGQTQQRLELACGLLGWPNVPELKKHDRLFHLSQLDRW